MELVENDILCFISTARHDKSFDEIVLTVQGFYDYENIKIAKDLLFDLCSKKVIRRKAGDKISKEIGDILLLFEEIDKEKTKIPKFVATRYDSLPPSSGFEAIARNMIHLSQVVDNLNEELKELRESKETLLNGIGDVSDLRAELSDIKKKMITMEQSYNRNATQKNNHVPLPTTSNSMHTSISTDGGSKPSFAEIMKKQNEEFLFYQRQQASSKSNNSNVRYGKDTFFTGTASNANKQKREMFFRRRDKSIRGTRTFETGLTGVSRNVDLYVGRCELKTTIDQVRDHINNICKVNVDSIEQLVSKSVYFKSFKLSMPYELREKLLDPLMWPTGIVVRKFYKARTPMDIGNAFNESNNDYHDVSSHSIDNK